MTSGRLPYSKRAAEAYQIIKDNPGIRKGELMKRLGCRLITGADALLTALEQRGYLVSEDGHRRLYAFSIDDLDEGQRLSKFDNLNM